MALTAWLLDGKVVVDQQGRPILCDHCPCESSSSSSSSSSSKSESESVWYDPYVCYLCDIPTSIDVRHLGETVNVPYVGLLDAGGGVKKPRYYLPDVCSITLWQVEPFVVPCGPWSMGIGINFPGCGGEAFPGQSINSTGATGIPPNQWHMDYPTFRCKFSSGPQNPIYVKFNCPDK